MSKEEQYNIIVIMIDMVQQLILQRTRDRIYLIAELEELQNDLAELRTEGRMKRKIINVENNYWIIYKKGA